MSISTPVRFFDSTMPNAPQLSGTPGTLRAILDACLVDGFDVKTVNDITISGDVATVNISSGHVFTPLDVIRIEGATPAALNNDWRVVSANGSQLTFDVSGTGLTNGTATGTITAKRAPAGWSKAFADGNTVVYRTAGTLPDRMDVRIDDTGTTSARIKCFNEATGLSSGVGEFPTEAEKPGGLYLVKSSTASTTVRRWVVVADHALAYLIVYPTDNAFETVWSAGFAFGLLAPTATGAPSVPYCEGALSSSASTNSYDAWRFPHVYHGHHGNFSNIFSSRRHRYVGRDISGAAASVCAFKYSFSTRGVMGSSVSAADNPGFAFPNPVDNAFICTPVVVVGSDPLVSPPNPVLMGFCPGLYDPHHTNPLSDSSIVTGVAGVAGGLLRLVRLRSFGVGANGESALSLICTAAFDIVGPWR